MTGKRVSRVLFLLSLLLVLSACTQVTRDVPMPMEVTSSGDYVHVASWGSYGGGASFSPGGVAVDSHGFVYVTGTGIQKFTPDGDLISMWAVSGSAIAVDNSGNVYVTRGHHIHKLDPSGGPILTWGGEGTGQGEFKSPSGLAVDRDGNVYVADRGNHRIQKFTPEGLFLTMWGGYGEDESQLISPHGVAVDNRGNVFVINTHRYNTVIGEYPSNSINYIHKFHSNGDFIIRWAIGTWEGMRANLDGIAVDSSGNVYVTSSGSLAADYRYANVLKLNPDGQFVTSWGGYGGEDGRLDTPQGIAVDSSGNVYVADRGNYRIQKFTSDGGFITKWRGQDIIAGGFFRSPQGIAVDNWGNVFVADTLNHRVQVFTSSGDFIRAWGDYSWSSRGGQFDRPIGVAVDSSRNVYVAHFAHRPEYNIDHRIQKFTSEGEYITSWGHSSLGFYHDFDVAVDSNDHVYVTGIGGISKYTPSGTEVMYIGTFGPDREFVPQGVAVDNSGNIFVTDWVYRRNNRVWKFNPSGDLMTFWGSEGAGDGQFNQPYGVAVDSSGRVFVADTLNHRIQVFTLDGDFVTSFGSYGTGDGQFNSPHDVAVDKSGNVYVVDTNNHRVQVFAPAQVTTPITISNVISTFDSYLASGDLYGTGPGRSASNRANALRNMLLSAQQLISMSDDAGACRQLSDAQRHIHTGGAVHASHFVTGAKALDFRNMIGELRNTLGCW